MKFLEGRQEIAEAINIKKYPVITIDLSRPLNGDDFYKNCYGGSRVVLATPTKHYPESEDRCTAMMFGDACGNENHDRPWTYKRIILQEGMVGISARFDLKDVRDMVSWNNAPHVKEGDTVVVFFDAGGSGWLRLMKVHAHLLVDIDE